MPCLSIMRSTSFFLPPFQTLDESEEEFAGWRSRSLLHKQRCCISLGKRFIKANKQECHANHIGGFPTLPHYTHIYSSCTKRHKANNSWKSWFGRQKGTSRTLILCDCSLLCTSKMTHYCVSGGNSSQLPGIKRVVVFTEHWSFFIFRGLGPTEAEQVGHECVLMVRGPVLDLSKKIPQCPFWRWQAPDPAKKRFR